jgi:beta-galactosidase
MGLRIDYLHMRTLFLLCCCICALVASAQRQHRSLDDGWRFHFGNAADPAKDFNYGTVAIFSKSGKAEGTAIAPDFDDRDWREMSVPHDWAVELPFENSSDFDVMAHGYKPVGGHYPATSIGWYRKRFVVAPADSGQRFVLQFDGIFRDSRVWVNGFYCCANASGYSGFSVDVTDFIRYGKENMLVVRVDATQYEGWFYEGAGIYRHVWLNQYNPVHIAEDGLFVHSEVWGAFAKSTAPEAEVTVETRVVNEKAVAASVDVAAFLTGRNGKVIGKGVAQAVNLGPEESKMVVEKIMVQRPVLGSPDQPYLYRAGAVIRSGGNVVDEEKIRVGIRAIRIDSTGLYVNGQYTKVKGVCNHQDHAGVGSALPDYLQYYRARLLKQMGVNAVRTSHNPPTPEWLDACDSLGLLVLDENRLLNSGPEYLDQFRRLVFRDRSRASVFMWSLGNEEGYVQTRPVGREIALTMMARLKEWDPTRTCTYAADVANVYQGINQVIPVRGFNYRIKGVDPYHTDHPGQPILGTEMGSTVTTRGIYEKDTVRCYVPDEDITAPWWANTAEQWWPLAADRSWWMGGFVWTGFDYRGEPTPYKWPNISSHFGVMDMCGFPKNIYYYYQSWWTDDDVLHISPHWNWKGKEGQAIPVWVNSNADQVELFLNGKSLGKKDMPRNSHLEWSIPYEAGKLEAVATKKGKRFTASVETTGDPYEVVVTPYKTTILADGKDATVLNISVVDKQGREVPDAENNVRFVAAGDLHIIGVGNGDPSSHEGDKGEDSVAERHLFNGHAQVIVQAGVKPGMYHFTASADSLHQGATDITTIVPGVAHSVLGWKPVGDNGKGKDELIGAVDKMMGADISFLPELEARGVKFSDDKGERDAIQILKDHGFNYIRLRIFNNPARDSGYSPGKGFCDLTHTMAKRVKAAGMRLLLDSYYPKWHGTLADLRYNVDDLARQYDKDVYVVEYTQRKQEVNDIAFSVPGRLGKGTCIWEPLNTWERIFERDGKANSLLYLYDELSKEFVRK